MNRRLFNKIGLGTLSTFILNSSINADILKSDKSCIFCFLHGGISHLDTTHAIRNAVSDPYKPVVAPVSTKSGFDIGGVFQEFSKLSDRFSVVKSFAHRDANHSTAAGWITTGLPMTGAAEGDAQKEPCYGSIIAHEFGVNTPIGIPHFVKTGPLSYGGNARRDMSAWLGAKYIGFDANQEGINNLRFSVDNSRMSFRKKMVDSLDNQSEGLYKSWAELRNQAFNVASGDASIAFDLTKESQENQTLFKTKDSEFGRSLLMAIRAIKYGSKFVTVVNGGWDMHSDIAKGFQAKGPELDWGLSLLLSELIKNELLDKTLVVITTEFGRTKMNIDNGRDHWNQTIPLIFAGGGYNHGREIGVSSKDNMTPSSKAFEPKDLAWTIGNHFGLDRSLTIVAPDKRPHHIFDETASIIL